MTEGVAEGGVVRRRFWLLDSGVELEVPSSRIDLLVPYPDHERRATIDVRVVVSRGPGREWLVSGAESTDCHSADLASTLLTAVNTGVLSRTSFLAIHAGVVSLNGAVVAFPGASGTGKSTLAAACLRLGFRYLSDEALCLDPASGTVQPFLRPLALDDRAWGLITGSPEATSTSEAEHVVAPEELGARPAETAQPLRHVVMLTRAAGHLDLAPAPRGDALAALLRHSFNHYRMPAQALDVVFRAVAGAQAWRLTYSDPLEAALLLAQAVTARC